MSATKNGNHIEVYDEGNTLSSITSDINDTAFIEKTSTDPDVYTIKGNVARYLRIYGELTIGDPEDYSVYERLEFDQQVTQLNRLYIYQGGHLKMYGNTVFDFVTHATNRAYYSYIYGAVTVQGDDTYKPILQNYRRLYFYEQQNNDTYPNDIWTFNKMIFGSGDANNEYCLYFNSMGKVRNHSFTEIEWDKGAGGRGGNMYCIYIPYGINGLENITFEDLTFTAVGNYPIYMNNAGSQEYKNCTFGTCASWCVYVLGTYMVDSAQTVGSYGYRNPEVYAQNFVFLNGCTFGAGTTAGILYANQGATVLCKDCEWQHTAGDSIQSINQSRVMMWIGNTFTGGREVYDLDYDGAVQWVHSLDLTIVDKQGNPIEDAKVGIAQSEGKETYTFRTNSDGKIINHFNINKALLTWKHQYGNNKTTNAEYWSDVSNGTYHTVRVFKMGYRPIELNYTMDDEVVDTVVLSKLDSYSLTF